MTPLYIALFFLAAFCLIIVLRYLWGTPVPLPLSLARLAHNPILEPIPEHAWESAAVFNPAAFVYDGRVHMFYRAIGSDGISRIGYASSADGLHFERLDAPVYDPGAEALKRAAEGRGKLSYATLTYDTVSYGSGGGWGGCEDPRAVVIDDQVCLTFTSFEGWSNVRIMLAQLNLADLGQGLFNWQRGIYLSAPGEVQKNWVLFPEKVRGKYALLHNIYPNIEIAYFNPAQIDDTAYIASRFERHARKGQWDTWMRGAGAPPLKTPHGWLLLYHAVDEKEPHKYKVGALLLDLKDPKKVLYRSAEPILEPAAWYENQWKPGVVYASGAVIFGDDLIVYYGGGDNYVAAARTNLNDFLTGLMSHQHATLSPAEL